MSSLSIQATKFMKVLIFFKFSLSSFYVKIKEWNPIAKIHMSCESFKNKKSEQRGKRFYLLYPYSLLTLFAS